MLGKKDFDSGTARLASLDEYELVFVRDYHADSDIGCFFNSLIVANN
jgi:hypothetical protein